jgi:hypothetical protein
VSDRKLPANLAESLRSKFEEIRPNSTLLSMACNYPTPVDKAGRDFTLHTPVDNLAESFRSATLANCAKFPFVYASFDKTPTLERTRLRFHRSHHLSITSRNHSDHVPAEIVPNSPVIPPTSAKPASVDKRGLDSQLSLRTHSHLAPNRFPVE